MNLFGCNNDTSTIRKSLDGMKLSDVCVSVVIPYFRRPTTLKQTLHSITQSTYNKDLIEIIIVDDGSPATDAPQITEFADTLNITVISYGDDRYRLSQARNVGILRASNDIVILLDSDVAVDPRLIETHVKLVSSSKKLISIGLRESRKVSDDLDPKVFSQKNIFDIGEHISKDWRQSRFLDIFENYQNSSKMWRLCSGGNIAFSKEMFFKVGFFNENFDFWGGEDTEWAYRAYKKGAYFFIDETVMSYHFESRSFEYQVDRLLDRGKKMTLLYNLVPSLDKKSISLCGSVPFISVFVTHYNKLKYLRECLTSIALATKYRFEIILIDDCSDCTKDEIFSEIPEDLQSKCKFVRLESHVGVEKSFSIALAQCQGEFIAQLDADDYLLPNAIDNLVKVLVSKDKDLAYGRHKVLKDGTLMDGWVRKNATRPERLLHGMQYHPLRVFRSRLLSRLGGMRILGLEGAVDFSLYSQLELASEAIFCDTFTYVYRNVEGSITQTKFSKQVDGVRKVIEDNAYKLSSTKDYKLSRVGEREYRVAFSENDTLGYKDHMF